MLDLTHEIEHARNAISAATLQGFAVPHLVVDDIFPDELVAQINELWPSAQHFQPEVPGNHILPAYRRDYARVCSDRQAPFWKAFNETLWPNVVAATAAALAGPAHEVFGGLYQDHLSPATPLTLMQADPTYPGHSMHTHFYHCPNWAFTMLLYIDPEDSCSHGTGLHQLLPVHGISEHKTSYDKDDIDWRVEVAMDTFHWLDPLKPDRRYRDHVVDYKANRLFVFLDGPLALHSVPFDNPDHMPNPARGHDGGRNARRRILRCHMKISERPFYAHHSHFPFRRLRHRAYARMMAPNAVLSARDQRYREKVIRPFFRERLMAYARAAESAAQAQSAGGRASAQAPQGWPSTSPAKFVQVLTGRFP